MKTTQPTGKKWIRTTAKLLLPVIFSGCSHVHLADKSPQINISKLKQSTDAVCGVAPFAYEPADSNAKDLMTGEDLAKWHQIYFDAVNLADICRETIRIDSANNIPQQVDYLIDGKITDFYFKKNWVPVFFPLHVGLSFITLTIYTWTAGPTTTTKVNLKYIVNLKDAKTKVKLAAIPESFKSTDVMTLYSSDLKNPYGNPGLALTPTINDSTAKLADALRKADAAKPHDTRPNTGMIEY